MHVTRLLSIAAFICTTSCGAANTTEIDDSTELFFKVSPDNGDLETEEPAPPITACSLMSPELSYAIVEVTDVTTVDYCRTETKYDTSTFITVHMLAPIYNTDATPQKFDLHLAHTRLPKIGQKVLYGFVENDGDYLANKSIFIDTEPSSDSTGEYLSPDQTRSINLPSNIGELKQKFADLSRTRNQSCTTDELMRAPTADLAIYPFTSGKICPALEKTESSMDPNGLNPPGD